MYSITRRYAVDDSLAYIVRHMREVASCYSHCVGKCREVNTSVCLSVTAGDVYTDAYSAAWHDTGRRVQPGSGGDREGY